MSNVELIAAARDNIVQSYAPFSKFRAGAAVRCSDDRMVPGVIVENVSLGLSMCAERVAMFSAVAQGTRPVALALAAPDTDGGPTWPTTGMPSAANRSMVCSDAAHQHASAPLLIAENAARR